MSVVVTAGARLRGWTPPVIDVPDLTVGVWTPITPDVDMTDTVGCSYVAFAPSDPNVLYATMDLNGLWRSTDRGSTWAQRGDIDSPVCVVVDPEDSAHIFVLQGVRAGKQGLWESHDGGNTLTSPAGFASSVSSDVTILATDPSDWNHQLLGYHSPWPGFTGGGILETTDAWATSTSHDPVSTWPAGSIGLGFLYDPGTATGNANTWVVITDGDGVHRTTNAGSSWTKVSSLNGPHGNAKVNYHNGVLYLGGANYPMRSTDNGVNLSQISSLDNFYYYGVWSDGTKLRTQLAFVADQGHNGLGIEEPFVESTDGITWSTQSGGQTFVNGPSVMTFDSVNRIWYAACFGAGLLAMKVGY